MKITTLIPRNMQLLDPVNNVNRPPSPSTKLLRDIIDQDCCIRELELRLNSLTPDDFKEEEELKAEIKKETDIQGNYLDKACGLSSFTVTDYEEYSTLEQIIGNEVPVKIAFGTSKAESEKIVERAEEVDRSYTRETAAMAAAMAVAMAAAMAVAMAAEEKEEEAEISKEEHEETVKKNGKEKEAVE